MLCSAGSGVLAHLPGRFRAGRNWGHLDDDVW